MLSRSETRLGLALLVLILAWAALPARAAETSNSEFVIIPEGDTFSGDLYSGSIRVIVRGVLDGDLIAFAAEDVVIEGTVTGSVMVLTPRVVVSGVVEGALRAVSRDVEISGTVEGDVVVAAVSASVGQSGRVAGEVLAWTWALSSLGAVDDDLTGIQRSTELAGSVGGDVDVSVGSLSVVDSLTVGGDLGYRSRNEAQGIELADVTGALVHKMPLAPNVRVRALGLLTRLLGILFVAATALGAVYGWRERTYRAIEETSTKPIRKWLIGAAWLASPLLLVLVTVIILGVAPASAAFPLLAVLVPLIVALLVVALMLAIVSAAPGSGWLGGVLFKNLGMAGSVLAGALIAGALWLVPAVGWLVPVVMLPLGLGAWLSSGPDQVEEAATAF